MTGGIDIVHAVWHVLEGIILIALALDWMAENERKRRFRERKRREAARKETVIYGDELEATN